MAEGVHGEKIISAIASDNLIFRVAILQKRAINAQISKNTESIIEAMKEAAKNDADILLDRKSVV